MCFSERSRLISSTEFGTLIILDPDFGAVKSSLVQLLLPGTRIQILPGALPFDWLSNVSPLLAMAMPWSRSQPLLYELMTFFWISDLKTMLTSWSSVLPANFGASSKAHAFICFIVMGAGSPFALSGKARIERFFLFWPYLTKTNWLLYRAIAEVRLAKWSSIRVDFIGCCVALAE